MPNREESKHTRQLSARQRTLGPEKKESNPNQDKPPRPPIPHNNPGPLPLTEDKNPNLPSEIIYHPEHGGAWLCPECKLLPTQLQHITQHPDFTFTPQNGLAWDQTPRAPKVSDVSERLWLARGYSHPPTLSNPATKIDKLYGGLTVGFIKNNYYFLNPAGVDECQNRGKKGFYGGKCGFSKRGVTGRIPAEPVEDSWKSVTWSMDGRIKFPFYCTQCAVPASLVNDSTPLGRAVKRTHTLVRGGVGNNIWDCKEDMWVRNFEYDGTARSLACKTIEYARGPHIRDAVCRGQYGDCGAFYLGTGGPKHWKPWDLDHDGCAKIETLRHPTPTYPQGSTETPRRKCTVQ